MLIPQVFWIPMEVRGGVMMSWTRERVFFMKERYCSHHPKGGGGGRVRRGREEQVGFGTLGFDGW
jgi:hypothetical protein